ncbi:ZIP zinc transporter-domain-containing protein [Circinella umbellata]|nr:ZIP zinc transporter-domain-containing protein [Circinella umbellata]
MEHDSSSSSEEEDNLYNDDEESNVPGSNEHSHHRQQQDNNDGEHQPIISKLNNPQLHERDYESTNHHHSQHHSLHHPQLFREAHFRFHPHSHHHHHHHHKHEHSDVHHDHNTHHQHEFQNQKSDLLRIGIQTAVAIGVHKFPEGLVMFISNQASEKLGWAIAAVMSIHNLTEGFMIVLPLYLGLKSRTAAFGWAALLGGLSQPIGALLGLLLMRNIDSDKENLMFGITFAVVSGMMTLITI